MKAALSVLFSMDQAKRRIAVLADMRELGAESRKLHREIGGFIAENAGKIDSLLLYGELSRDIEEGLHDALSDKAEGIPETLHFEDERTFRAAPQCPAVPAVAYDLNDWAYACQLILDFIQPASA